MNWHELQKAQDAAVAKTEGRELIPQGLDNLLDFAQAQIIRARTGQPLQPEEGNIWRKADGYDMYGPDDRLPIGEVRKMPLRWTENPWPDA